jgi:predicted HTH transcriptional regulator
VQIGRFAGIDRTELLDMQAIDDLPVPAIDRALALTLAHSRKRFEIRGSRRQSVGFVPESALREAIINAVVHADYSQRGSRIRIAVFADRVEVENPGLLPFGVTLEDIRSGHSKLRNRVIGRTFHELGLIEQWGTGVRRMIDSCRTAGIAEPTFEEIGVHFRVVMRFAEAGPRTRPDPEVLELLEAHGSMSTAELAAAIGRTPKTARSRLQRLVDAGLVVVIGSGPRDPRRRYRLRDPG